MGSNPTRAIRYRLGGVAQTEEHSLVRRRAPVRARSSPFVRGGRGVTAASEVVILAVPVRIRSVALLFTRTLSIRRAHRAVTASPRAVMVRLHPSAPLPNIDLGMKLSWQSSPLAPGRLRVRLPPSPSPSRLRSVNGKHAPFVRPRCGFNSCRRLSNSPATVDEEGSRRTVGSRLRPRERGSSIRRGCCVRSAAEHRVATRRGPFEPGRPLGTSPWCSRQHGELQPRTPGFESWRACSTTDRPFSESDVARSRGRAPPRLRRPPGCRGHTHHPTRGETNAPAHRSGCGAPPQDAAPGKGDPARDASQGAARAGTARAVASPTGRLRRSEKGAARQVRAGGSHPADVAEQGYAPVSETGGFGHEGSTPSVRTPRRPRATGVTERRPPEPARRGQGRLYDLPSVAQSGRAPGFDPGRRGSTPLGGLHHQQPTDQRRDTVAERRGTRLQRARRRFDSARCLSANQQHR